MKCRSTTKQFVNGWKICEKCKSSWSKSYGATPNCSYREMERMKSKAIFDEMFKKPLKQIESFLEFSHDIKLDKRQII